MYYLIYYSPVRERWYRVPPVPVFRNSLTVTGGNLKQLQENKVIQEMMRCRFVHKGWSSIHKKDYIRYRIVHELQLTKFGLTKED